MSRSTLVLLAAAALALPAADLSAQDPETRYAPVLGSWESEFETPGGTFTQTFVFRVENGALAGTASSQRGGDTALDNVSFEDGTLTFQVTREMRGNSFTLNYTATVDGDEMTGTVAGGRGGDREFSATRKSS